MTENRLSGLLRPAQEIEPRLKLLLWGDTGTGKTWSALTIAAAIGGRIAMLDPERGSRLYAGRFEFDLLPTDDITELQRTVRMLAQGGHDYRTLIIDPISLLWSAWQEQWEARFLVKNVGRAGHRGDWYELGMKDWAPIKRTWEGFLRNAIGLDLNLIVTAREKSEFEGSGDQLRKVGDMPDCEKRLPYWFDSVIRLVLTKSGKRLADTRKDRTGKFPAERVAWSWDLDSIADAIGTGGFGRDVRTTLADEPTIQRILDLARELNIGDTWLGVWSRRECGVASIQELSPDQAETLVERLVAKHQEVSNG